MQMTDLRESLINLMLQDWLKGRTVDDLARELLVSKQTVEELLRQIVPLYPSQADACDTKAGIAEGLSSPQPAAETESERARRPAIEAAEEHDRQDEAYRNRRKPKTPPLYPV